MTKKTFKRFSCFEWITLTPQSLPSPTFLRLQQFKVRHHFDDHSAGPIYSFETVTTPCMDAVVIIIYTMTFPFHVILRQGIRPAVACRTLLSWPGTVDEHLPHRFWELPAGGIETSDWEKDPEKAVYLRAEQETWEEVGLHLSAKDFFELGPAIFMASAFCPERIHFTAAALPSLLPLDTPPPGDGHPMEQGAWAEWLPVEEAMNWCRQGRIADGKTEIGLRRLAEYLSVHN
jgi:ADP-ribose pyrophosphatase